MIQVITKRGTAGVTRFAQQASLSYDAIEPNFTVCRRTPRRRTLPVSGWMRVSVIANFLERRERYIDQRLARELQIEPSAVPRHVVGIVPHLRIGRTVRGFRLDEIARLQVLHRRDDVLQLIPQGASALDSLARNLQRLRASKLRLDRLQVVMRLALDRHSSIHLRG